MPAELPPTPVIAVLAALVLAFVFVAISFVIPSLRGAPWVPSPTETIRKMLVLAKLKPGERLYDLGSGDGRIVLISAREFGAISTGIEIDPFRASYSRLLIRLSRLGGRARVVRSSFYTVNLSDADVVTLYLLQETNDRLKPKLEKELKPTCRVVSRVFKFDWDLIDADLESKIYVYSPKARVDPQIAVDQQTRPTGGSTSDAARYV